MLIASRIPQRVLSASLMRVERYLRLFSGYLIFRHDVTQVKKQVKKDIL